MKKTVAVAFLVLCLAGTAALVPASVAAQGPQDCVTCANGQLKACEDDQQAGQTHVRNEGTHLTYYCFSCSVKHPPSCKSGSKGPPLYEEDIEEVQDAIAANDAPAALRQPDGSPGEDEPLAPPLGSAVSGGALLGRPAR